VPERRNHDKESVIAGRRLFYEIGCAACHYPSFKTGYDEDYPHLSNQVIWPYTDLLLHDMGKGLADGRPDYLASGSEWRTPPLWGIGLSKQVNGAQNFLHDGRARTVEEAILWHGGEAEQVKQRFIRLDKKEREKLIEFVNSL
ncbi:MAG TPA: c-type cytochrome, partial [Sulfurivirga caldicuralii]|nr:c-type cytochrome [Sulfurivirga caldicuralii]